MELNETCWEGLYSFAWAHSYVRERRGIDDSLKVLATVVVARVRGAVWSPHECNHHSSQGFQAASLPAATVRMNVRMKTVKTFETSFIAALKFEFILPIHRLFYQKPWKLTNKLRMVTKENFFTFDPNMFVCSIQISMIKTRFLTRWLMRCSTGCDHEQHWAVSSPAAVGTSVFTSFLGATMAVSC